MSVRIIVGDCRVRLREMPAGSVHCVVTSPPYYGLRDYGTGEWAGGDPECDHKPDTTIQTLGANSQRQGRKSAEAQRNQTFEHVCGRCGAERQDGQIGLEASPEEFIAQLVAVFDEVWRVLRDDGVLWLHIGASYASRPNGTVGKDGWMGPAEWRASHALRKPGIPQGLKHKDLMLVPARLAIALQQSGWYVRRDIIWSKPNAMPESTTDRCTTAHEYVFMLTKSPAYFYDAEAIYEKSSPESHARSKRGRSDDHKYADGGPGNQTIAKKPPSAGRVPGVGPKTVAAEGKGNVRSNASFQAAISGEVLPMRNKRSVWTIHTEAHKGNHFATFPQALVQPCILAATSAKGCCSSCGAPWARITERTPMVIARSDRTHSKGQTRSSGTMLSPARSVTLRWEATCACAAPVIPCTVLDPFGGSGTTGLVAERLGRNAILIELNPKYAADAQKRIRRGKGVIEDPVAEDRHAGLALFA